MSEARTYYTNGRLKKLVIINNDRELNLQLSNITRRIPKEVASIIYQELNSVGTITATITKTRQELLTLSDTYSFIFNYVYYLGGEIDTIRIRTYDATATKISDRILKHYLNGKQPEFM